VDETILMHALTSIRYVMTFVLVTERLSLNSVQTSASVNPPLVEDGFNPQGICDRSRPTTSRLIPQVHQYST